MKGIPLRSERNSCRDKSRPSSTGGLRSRECGPRRRWWAGLGLAPGGGGGAVPVPVPEGPTSEVGLEPRHRAGLVVASSCRVVVGVGVGKVAAGSVVVVVVAEEPHLLEEPAASSLLCCFCF